MMKSNAFAVGTTPVLLAKGPTRVSVALSGGSCWLGDAIVTVASGLRIVESFECALLPNEKLFGISDAVADVRVLEYGLQ